MGKRQSWIHKITFFFSPPLANLHLLFLSLFSPPFLCQQQRGEPFWIHKFILTVNRIRGRTTNTHLGWVHLLRYAKGYLIIAGQCFSEGPRGWLCVCVSTCVHERKTLGIVPHRYTHKCPCLAVFSPEAFWQCVCGHSKASAHVS